MRTAYTATLFSLAMTTKTDVAISSAPSASSKRSRSSSHLGLLMLMKYDAISFALPSRAMRGPRKV